MKKTPNHINFTAEERYIIAEYVYSNQQDVLIKGDAHRLVTILAKRGWLTGEKQWNEKIENNMPNISLQLNGILKKHITNPQLHNIMEEYYRGAIPGL